MRYGNLLFLAGALCFQAQAQLPTKFSGPYTHDNLSIFLIHQTAAPKSSGPAKDGTKASTVRYLALQPAMQQKKVVVYETNQVNDLAIENFSAESVFIQQGDIVKGGNQDRMISNDFILPAKSGRIPLAAFCVEQGRWSQRGNESARAFSVSTELSAIRFVPKAMWSQMSVWQTVSQLQEALASRLRTRDSTGLGAVSTPSPTSLMLTQTSPPVEDAVGAYTRVLAGVVLGKTGVVGFAVAINGEVKSADVYASPELFSAMWPKLLKAAAIEAVRLRGRAQSAAVAVSRVEAFLREADSGKETVVDVDRRIKLVRRESEASLLVESREGTNWVHRSVVQK